MENTIPSAESKDVSLIIELDPPNGITGFPIGMPADEVKKAAAVLGKIVVSDEGSARLFRSMKVLMLHAQFEIMFHLENGKTLTAVEVGIPESGDIDISVLFHGIDVFRTPAIQLLDQLRALGNTIEMNEEYHPIVPGLTLGFTREAGHDVPLDTDGLPLFFQAVLVGPTNYYNQ